eukprot:s47_g14.t1
MAPSVNHFHGVSCCSRFSPDLIFVTVNLVHLQTIMARELRSLQSLYSIYLPVHEFHGVDDSALFTAMDQARKGTSGSSLVAAVENQWQTD